MGFMTILWSLCIVGKSFFQIHQITCHWLSSCTPWPRHKSVPIGFSHSAHVDFGKWSCERPNCLKMANAMEMELNSTLVDHIFASPLIKLYHKTCKNSCPKSPQMKAVLALVTDTSCFCIHAFIRLERWKNWVAVRVVPTTIPSFSNGRDRARITFMPISFRSFFSTGNDEIHFRDFFRDNRSLIHTEHRTEKHYKQDEDHPGEIRLTKSSFSRHLLTCCSCGYERIHNTFKMI